MSMRDLNRGIPILGLVILVFSPLFMAIGGGGGAGGTDINSTATCTVGYFSTSISETSGTLGIVCNQVGWTQLTGYPSGCPATQFVISVGATLTCSTPPSDTASTTQCSTSGQDLYNVTESSAGVLTGLCRYPDWTKLINFPVGCSAGQFVTGVGITLTCSSVAWTQITSFPAACSAGQYVTAVGATLTCGNPEPNTSATCSLGFLAMNVSETSGSLVIQCTQEAWNKLINFPSGCSANQFVTAVGVTLTCSAVAWSGLTGFPTGCTAGQFVTGVGVTLTCSAVAWTQLTSFPSGCAAGQFVTVVGSTLTCGSPNIAFSSNANTCTDVTLTTKKMMGFALTYTTVGTGKVVVTINFEVSTPGTAGLNTKWQLAFSTGTAPICNAAVTGTTVGNQYEVGTFSTTGSFEEDSVTVGITTLSAATTYWFDLQVSDSTTAAWIYSLPQMTVIES